MNQLVPLQVLHWPHQNYTECGVMLLDLQEEIPVWMPLIPLEVDAWGDGLIRPDPDHLFQCSYNWWELRRLPSDHPTHWSGATGKGRMARSRN